MRVMAILGMLSVVACSSHAGGPETAQVRDDSGQVKDAAPPTPLDQPCDPGGPGTDIAYDCTDLFEVWPDGSTAQPMPICLDLSKVCSFLCITDDLRALCGSYGGKCTGTNGDGYCDPSPE